MKRTLIASMVCGSVLFLGGLTGCDFDAGNQSDGYQRGQLGEERFGEVDEPIVDEQGMVEGTRPQSNELQNRQLDQAGTLQEGEELEVEDGRLTED